MILAVFMLPSISNGQTIFEIGTGTSYNGTSSYPAPYGSYFGGSKNQMIFTAAELIAAGASTGSIETIAFNVRTVKGTALDNFTIKIGTTTESASSSTFETGLTEVFTTAAYTDVSGWNTHTLTTPFAWDGVSNIVVETSLQNSTTTTNSRTYYTSTSSNSCTYYRGYSVSSSTSGTTSVKRPNIQFGINMVPETNDLEIVSWETPITPLVPTAASSVSVKISNVGVETVDTFDISYSIDGGTSFVVETLNDSLQAGADLIYTFSTTANMPTGTYNCIAAVHNGGDTITANDSLIYTLFVGDPLTGIYNVGSATTADYSTINAIVADIELYGVSGPVTINLAAEMFDEKISIDGPIAGVSASNNIIIKGHGASTIINTTNTGSTDRDVFRIKNQDYVTIDSVSISSTSTSKYNTGVHIWNSNYITIKNCNITLQESTSDNTNGIIVSGDLSSITSSTTSDYLVLENNIITNGYYSFRTNGSSSSHSTNLTVKNNTFVNYYNYGLYSIYQDSIIITNNTLQDRGANTAAYGIYLKSNELGATVANNSIVVMPSSLGSGLYLDYCNGSVAKPFMVYNNMVVASKATGTYYGIYFNYGKNVTVYNNTISLNSGGTSSAALYVKGSTTSSNMENVKFINNIFSNKGLGYAVQFYGTYYPAKVTEMDYNNVYTSNSAKFAKFGGDEYTDLTAWKLAAYGLDSNSVSTDPLLVSTIDGHSSSIAMDNKGFAVSEVLLDFDGETRSLTTPDIGADEYSPLSNDVAIIEKLSPIGTIVALNTKTPIELKVVNFGTNNQTILPFTWSQDGGTTMVCDTIAVVLNSLDTAIVTLTDSLFFDKYRMNEVSIALNIANDGNRNNDTVKETIASCSTFNGAYTLGGNNADFESFNQAITMINHCGVSGPVVINVNTGVYNEQFEISEITGVTSTNTLTFQSVSGNNADVKLEFSPTSSDNYIVYLDGADNITFKDISFSTANSGDYGRIFYFKDNADSNTVIGCDLVTKYDSDDNFAAIYANGDLNNANTFENNSFKDCYAAAYWKGEDDDDDEYGVDNVFINNEISHYKKYALYLKYQSGIEVVGNKINGSSETGLRLESCDESGLVSKNTIVHTGKYALYIYKCYASSSTKLEISNNMISEASSIGIYDYYPKYHNIFNNTVRVNSTDKAFYFYNSSSSYKGSAIYNNNFVNEGSGYAAYFKKGDYIDSCDYNNFYSPSGDFVYWGTSIDDITELISEDGDYNQNSYAIDPVFASATDMHLWGNMDNLGLVIDSIVEDVYGNVRSLTTPDIGAEEFTFHHNNVSVNDITVPSAVYCGSLTDSIWIDVRNIGDLAQDTIPVKAMITTPTGVVNVVDTLFANVAGTSIYNGFLLTTLNTTAEGDYTVKVYTDLVNDGDVANDTMEVVFNTSDFVANYPYSETFDSWPPANWDMNGGDFGWNYSSDRALADFKNNDTLNCIMMTPPVDLTGSTLPKILFSYKYNYDNTISNYDSIAVQIKTCGNTWLTLWAKGSERLSTVDPITSVAGYNDIELDIPSNYIGQEVFVRFNGISDGGANVYITDVLIAEYPAINLVTDTASCVGDVVVLDAGTGLNYSYSWTTFSDTAVLATTQLYTVSETDTFVVTVTDNNTGLMLNDTVKYISHLNPAAPTYSGLATDYCEDAAVVTLSGLPSGGVFTGNGISGNDFDPSTATAGSNDIEYTYTDLNGCSNSVINSTTINTLPTISISGLATDYCVDGSDVALTATPAGTGSVWSGDVSLSGDFSPSTQGVGTHTVLYAYTDANGCVNTDSVSTMVNALPTITISTLADVCADENNVIITGATPAGGNWSGNGVSSNLFNATNAGSGSHYLTYTYTDANGCSDFDSTIQLVNALPVLNVTGFDADYCANADNDTLSATPAGGTFFGMGMTANVFDPSVLNAGSVSVMYMYTDAITGCFNSESVTTIVNAIPVVDLGSDNTVCEYSSSMLDAGNAGSSFLWNTGATTQTITLDTVGNGIGDVNYSVIVTDANMCSNADSVEITYEATPVSQLTDTNTICGVNADITLDAGYVSGNSYVWSNGVNYSSVIINSTVLGGNMGNMSVEITSDGGCVFNDTTFVYFREIPVVDLGGDEIVCVNHEFTIDAGAGFTSYLWNTGATTQSITVDSNTFDLGSNMYKVEVYNDVNCSAMDSINLIVDPCTGVQMPELATANINIYPNPSTGLFQIDVDGLENEDYNLDIYNSLGSVVYSDKVSNDGSGKQTWKLDFSSYAKGVYYVRLHSNGDIKVKRIVIQ